MRTAIREAIETIALAVFLVLILQTTVQNYRVEGPSMNPRLETLDRVLVNKVVYTEVSAQRVARFVPGLDATDGETWHPFHSPQRGDVVVFKWPRDISQNFVKRVIALPGERVRIQGGTVFVNGVPVKELFLGSGAITFTDKGNPVEASVDVRVVNPDGLDSTLGGGLSYTAEFSLERQAGSLSIRQATHLLRRMGFGATQAEINAAVSAGTSATISALLSYANDDTVEQDALSTFYGSSPPPAPNLPTFRGQYWWIHLLRNNSNAFQERLAFFLHDHFATSGRDMNADVRWALYNQINLFRRFSLATDRTLDNGEPGLGYNWKQFCIENSS